ncbi:hypothetical protein HKD37_19G054064 [Glycine soja]
MENVYVIKHKEGGLHAYDVEMIVEENLLKEELVSWDSQWRITLVVNVLGEKGYKFTLFKGSWMVADHCLLAKELKKMCIWHLPIKLYNEIFLKRIGEFARACVELDLDKPLVTHIIPKGSSLYLKYGCLHAIFLDVDILAIKKINAWSF